MSAGEPGESVASAWEKLIADILDGVVDSDLRSALLARLINVVDNNDQLDDTSIEVSNHYSFLPAEDIWAGWWADDDEPQPWPPGTMLTPDRVVRAIRRVPLTLRTILILRDAAGLSAAESVPIMHCGAEQQAALLDTARDAFIGAIDDEVTNEDAGIQR
jgi:DNA-directed RNA polymerase specialized sigma24 family protein